jgi:hypothetical protein
VHFARPIDSANDRSQVLSVSSTHGCEVLQSLRTSRLKRLRRDQADLSHARSSA